jgi:hypothetical protein
VVGATVRDNLSGRTQAVYARTVVNAAGPFVDEVRHLSEVRAAVLAGSFFLHGCSCAPPAAQPRTARQHVLHGPPSRHAQGPAGSIDASCLWFGGSFALQPAAPKMIMPSSGVHVALPDYYSPENGELVGEGDSVCTCVCVCGREGGGGGGPGRKPERR